MHAQDLSGLIDTAISTKACDVLLLYMYGLGTKAKVISASLQPEEVATVVDLMEFFGCRDDIKADFSNDVVDWMRTSEATALALAKELAKSPIICGCCSYLKQRELSFMHGAEVAVNDLDKEDDEVDSSHDSLSSDELSSDSDNLNLNHLEAPWFKLKLQVCVYKCGQRVGAH